MAINPKKRVIVVGGGLAGLACTIKLAEEGMNVDLFSMVPVKRSHSVCAQGGINACNDIARQQGYSEWVHFDETALGGDFLADQPPLLEMAYMAPKIIDLLDRMGVPFNRTPEGQRELRLFGGSLFKRTFFAGATTGQQLLYALDEQTRRAEAEGKVNKYEFWEFLWPIVTDGPDGPQCVGIVAQDMRTMQIRAFRGDAVVIATGGNGLVFGKSTMSVICTGGALARCYQAGALYGNPEMMQVHPTAIPGEDKCRLISESARGEGGRVWVPKKQGDTRHPNSIPEDDRDYFLERMYPKYGNIVPRDIATREIFNICLEGYGVGGGNMVYLDLRDKVKQIGREAVLGKLEGILEIYEKFVGTDPLDEPMKIFPAIHYSMGGLWTTFQKKERSPGGLEYGHPLNASTNIPGLYAMGEVNFAYHGANRLGANSLLSCIFDGLFCGPSVKNFALDTKLSAADVSQSVYDGAVKQETDRMNVLINSTGSENPYKLWQEMGKAMTENCTVVRYNDKLESTLEQCQDWKARYKKVRLSDTGMWSNQNLSFARAVRDMILQAEAILKGALLRNESRGAHYKPDFKERDDANFLKATVAAYNPATESAEISYKPVDTSLVPPRARTYGKTAPVAAKAEKPVAVPAGV
ncbi:succinate dehydrogenase flavoprotein subunit [Humisphaera borealis]|uniref:succinate dehydrogenase n=1 Tax=Humisphaera borealis TaxID=2807512 RepID=A0A7M2X1I2_9BACT|nr:succinate dehydrogenase flavoprotein subunit [Humisphaera borealis]QOV91606.1 succinate dehydrogenase flavoprotein subunit [Humisphaera borealis]